MSQDRQTATVVALLRVRGFGFLRTSSSSKDIFFHVSNFDGTPELGMTVEFELGEPTKLGQPKPAVKVVPVVADVCEHTLGGGFNCSLPKGHTDAHYNDGTKWGSIESVVVEKESDGEVSK